MIMEQATRYSEKLIEALEIALRKKLIFAIYKLPGHKETTLVIQKNQDLIEIDSLSQISTQSGFLVTPFNSDSPEKSYIIRPDYVFTNDLQTADLKKISDIPDCPKNGSAQIGPYNTDKNEYLDQLDEIIRQIKMGEYEKVVLSRAKIVKGAYYDHLGKIFQLLANSYPQSFVYLFNIKDHCWAGASPEPLVLSEHNSLLTVSLAGTRPFSEKNFDVSQWNHKERLEQEYVTRYIEKILREYRVNSYRKIGPYAKKAAQVIHLRTDFIFDLNEIGENLPALIQALHPTSAVCGMPKGKALSFLRQIEKHNREYYAGFLGPVGMNEKLQLFVNLRCMKVLQNQLALFIGGGITSDSIPEEEWEETEIKAETLLSVINQIH